MIFQKHTYVFSETKVRFFGNKGMFLQPFPGVLPCTPGSRPDEGGCTGV